MADTRFGAALFHILFAAVQYVNLSQTLSPLTILIPASRLFKAKIKNKKFINLYRFKLIPHPLCWSQRTKHLLTRSILFSRSPAQRSTRVKSSREEMKQEGKQCLQRNETGRENRKHPVLASLVPFTKLVVAIMIWIQRESCGSILRRRVRVLFI